MILRFVPIGPDLSRLASIADRNFNTVILSYDGAGRLQRVNDPAGRGALQ